MSDSDRSPPSPRPAEPHATAPQPADTDSSQDESLPRRRKHKKRRTNLFIEDQAAVDEDDEGDESEEEEGFVDEVDDFDDVERPGKNRHRALDARKEKEQEIDAEEIAARLKERYGRTDSLATFRGDVEHVPQNVLIPSVDDPKLWLIACRPGKEKDIIINMVRKQFDMELRKTPLQILSCFFRESIPGYIYIEAFQQAHVMGAVQGMSNLYVSKLRLVPVNEMVDCLTIKAKSSELKLGAWIRIKRGKYATDLGQVLELSEIGDTATIKLIPRLDLSSNGKEGAKRKKGGIEIRQPQKLFNPNDVK